MSFDASLRIALETTAAPGSLQSQLVTELSALDKEAARLHKVGENPIDVLRPRVDGLRSSVSRVRAETIERNQDAITGYKLEYITRRDKRSSAEIMRQNDARIWIGSLGDKDIESLATEFINGADLDIYSLREIQARLRSSEGGGEHLSDPISAEISDRRIDQPWIAEDEKASALADEIDLLEATEPGTVRIETDDMVFVSEITDLVDYNGELDAPA